MGWHPLIQPTKNMLQNIKKSRGGFTLVEIMIVVAIIALLATLATPNIMRARLRAQASAVKTELSQIDAAIDQWALEKNKKTGDAITITDLAAYVKSNSTLATQLAAGAVTDALTNAITIKNVGDTLAVPTDTATALKAVTTDVDANYWKPFTSGT